MDIHNEGQQEFFQEFKEPKGSIDRLREKYVPPKNSFVTVSVENLVLYSIIIIIIVVLFFSLGVERGKHISGMKIAKLEKHFNKVNIKPEIKPEKDYNKIKSTSEVTRIVKDKPQNIVEEKKVSSVQKELPKDKYTIQIVTYRSEATANKKISALKREGYTAFIIPRKNLFQICVGKYRTIEEVKAGLVKLRKQYSDCFIRNIE